MDLMIDIETLGVRPGSAVTSIGAVYFNPASGAFGEEFYRKIDVHESVQKFGLTIDTSTIQWWLDQTKEAQSELFAADNENLAMVLRDFKIFFDQRNPTRVWANSPNFDLVLIESVYRAVGQPLPWGHRVPRCTRTLWDITEVSLKEFEIGVKHNALDDARSQANAVVAAYKVLSSSGLHRKAA